MSTINLEFNIGDTVYFICDDHTRYPFVGMGVIARITIDESGIIYVVDDQQYIPEDHVFDTFNRNENFKKNIIDVISKKRESQGDVIFSTINKKRKK